MEAGDSLATFCEDFPSVPQNLCFAALEQAREAVAHAMRILLDESLVFEAGWSGVQNGKLLALAAGQFDVFVTADHNLQYQQNLAALPLAVVY